MSEPQTPVMRAAAEAVKRVATWSTAKQEYAKRVTSQRVIA